MSRALSPGLMMLTAALIDGPLREAGLEHRSRFVASGDETGGGAPNYSSRYSRR